jgi:hypothetical protein
MYASAEPSSRELPLAEIGCQNVIYVNMDAVDHETRVGRGDDLPLEEHGGRLTLAP